MAAIEKEIGHGGLSMAPWSAFFDTIEETPELQWPNSIAVYNRMRTDAQVVAVLLATTLPIRRYDWFIDPNGARDEVVEFVAKDFNLPIEGQEPEPQRRARGRFSHDHHLRHALLALSYGHFFFEQVYRIENERVHIRKLAPRMPGTISEIGTARDGGLEYIKQHNYGYFGPGNGGGLLGSYNALMSQPMIPVTRLVAYVNEQEGGNWYGRPVLRSGYKHWLIKDRLLRVDAMKHERNGMGVPIIEAAQNSSDLQMRALDALAQAYKAGEAAGGVLPYGAKLRLVGTEGSMPDTLGSIKYHDEQIAKNMLEMVMQLGTTETGSRALGETFQDKGARAQEAIAKQYCDTTNEHVVEDLVDLNWGENEPAPLLKYSTEGQKMLTIAELGVLAEKGILTPDAELEAYVRSEYDLPEKEEVEEPPPAPAVNVPFEPVVVPVEPDGEPVAAAQANGRPLRRELTENEGKAGIDFDSMEEVFRQTADGLVAEWANTIKPAQIEELVGLITKTDDLAALASIQATPIGAELLAVAMKELAEDAADKAAAEVVAQGVAAIVPDLTEMNTRLASRAEALDVLMARSISETAGRVALRESGGPLSPAQVARSVEKHLNELSDAYLDEQLGGALMQAQNTARREVFGTLEGGTYIASELLDPRTCRECAAPHDGTEYASQREAESDYPSGGYKNCLGGPRCRGTLVWVASDEQKATVQ